MEARTPPRGWLLLPLALLVGLVVLGLAVVVSRATGAPIGVLTRDVSTLSAETTEPLPPYAGAVGLLTSIVWGSAAVLACFVAWLVLDRRRWLLVFALLLALLTADDALSLHEQVAPTLGVPEMVVQGGYALLAVGLAAAGLRNAASLRRPAPAFLAFLVGGALLAASLVVDVVLVRQHLLEDGLKLLGALAWLTVPVLAFPPRPAAVADRVYRAIPDQRDAGPSEVSGRSPGAGRRPR